MVPTCARRCISAANGTGGAFSGPYSHAGTLAVLCRRAALPRRKRVGLVRNSVAACWRRGTRSAGRLWAVTRTARGV
ncbi:hypothetical protein B0T18DRAFT_395356 [Schizothecium vesticola]|uniref:Uncharacterized protein n=1 Tax=Schizothecium vesticola TaxID=314040 RepID=A0AA40F851_9PEZI|nr:hypothetical protein B0T18DRAFT_395356 [Schizothecium vesticola]